MRLSTHLIDTLSIQPHCLPSLLGRHVRRWFGQLVVFDVVQSEFSEYIRLDGVDTFPPDAD